MSDIQATSSKKVSASFLHTTASGDKTVLFPEAGKRVKLDDDFNPIDDIELSDEEVRHIEDMKGVDLGRRASTKKLKTKNNVTIPGSDVTWSFTKDWLPFNWTRAPSRPEAQALYQVIHRETKRVFNPEELMQYG